MNGMHAEGDKLIGCYSWLRRATECPAKYNEMNPDARPNMEVRLGATDGLLCTDQEKENVIPAAIYMLLR
jgi:hypothetical protein